MATTARAPVAHGSAATPSGRLRPDIEGLRAVAVGTVVAYHAGFPGVSGGFVGVDIFFVISGFLITSLLLREVERSGTISLAGFYARRARRLLPAASVVLVVTAVASWFVEPVTRRGDLGTDVVTATFYAINWSLAGRAVDYLAEDAVPSPLQHYWSLSVEEQFYLVWPALILLGLLLASRRGLSRRRVTGWMLTTVAVASLAWSLHLTPTDPARAYFVTTTRLWELAIGALLAFGVGRAARLPRVVREGGAWLGLLAVLGSAVVFTRTTPWPGSAALVPTLGCALVIGAGVAGPTTAGRLLSWRPLVWIGGLSYAIYLWHWPVLRLAEDALGRQDVLVRTALGLSAILLAWLTKHLVEDPVRYARPLTRSSGLSLALAAVLMLTTAGTGWAIRASLPRVGALDVPAAAALAAGTDPSAPPPLSGDARLRSDPEVAYTRNGSVEPDPAVATEDIPAYYEDNCQVPQGVPDVDLSCQYGDPNGDTVVALLGDSKMGQWFDAFDAIAKERHWRLDLYLKSACGFTTSGDRNADCNEFGRNVLRVLAEPDRRPDLAFVSSGSGPRSALADGMVDAITRVRKLGTTVAVVANTPVIGTGTKKYECVADHPEDYSACWYPQEKDLTLQLADVVERTGAPVIDLGDWICPTQDACPSVIGKALVYRQGSHITRTYIMSLQPLLDARVAALLRKTGATG